MSLEIYSFERKGMKENQECTSGDYSTNVFFFVTTVHTDLLRLFVYSHATKGKLCKAQVSAHLKESCFKRADLNSNYLNTANK